jgi:hypothetical protein
VNELKEKKKTSSGEEAKKKRRIHLIKIAVLSFAIGASASLVIRMLIP